MMLLIEVGNIDVPVSELLERLLTVPPTCSNFPLDDCAARGR